MKCLLMTAAAVVSLAGLGLAGEETVGAMGEAATLRVDQPGGRFEIVVTPPPDRAVDKRILAWLGGVESEADSDKPVDLSGYNVRVSRAKESEKSTAASCSGKFSIKAKPVNLAPNKGWTFQSSAPYMDISAFPTKGDVDVAIFYGPDSDLSTCDISARGKAQMDSVTCINTDCQNHGSNDDNKGIIGNITSSQATYVGVYNVVFISTP
jgi:hypothetical protein